MRTDKTCKTCDLTKKLSANEEVVADPVGEKAEIFIKASDVIPIVTVTETTP